MTQDTSGNGGEEMPRTLLGLDGQPVDAATLVNQLEATQQQLRTALTAVDHNLEVVRGLTAATPEATKLQAGGIGWYECGGSGQLYWNGQYWQRADGLAVDPWSPGTTAVSPGTPGYHGAPVADPGATVPTAASAQGPSGTQTALLTVGGVLVSVAGLAFAFLAYQWLPLPLQWLLLLAGTLLAGAGAVALRRKFPIASGAFAAIAYVLALVVVGAAPAKHIVPADWSPVAHPDSLWFPVTALVVTGLIALFADRLDMTFPQVVAAATAPAWWAWSWLALAALVGWSSIWAPLLLVPLSLPAVASGARADGLRLRLGEGVPIAWGVLCGSAIVMLALYVFPIYIVAAIASVADPTVGGTGGRNYTGALAVLFFTLELGAAGLLVARATSESAELELTPLWRRLLITATLVSWVAVIQSLAALVILGLSEGARVEQGAGWLLVLLACAPMIVAGVMIRAGKTDWSVLLASPLVFILAAPLFLEVAPLTALFLAEGAMFYVVGLLTATAWLVRPAWVWTAWWTAGLWWVGVAITTSRPMGLFTISVLAVTTLAVGCLRTFWFQQAHPETKSAPPSLVWALLPIVGWSLVATFEPPFQTSGAGDTQRLATLAALAVAGALLAALGVKIRLAGFIVGGVLAAAWFAALAGLPFVSGYPTWVYLLVAGLVLLAAGVQVERLRRGERAARSFLSECH